MALHTFDHHAIEDALPKSALMARLQQFPALMAFCIQLFSAVLLGIGLYSLTYLANAGFQNSLVVPVGALFILQAVVSSFLSYQLGMASWWKWIHFAFPILVWVMLVFAIPTEIYLIGFIVTASMFWSTFRTQVPYYPSRLNIWQRVSEITHQYQAQYSNAIRVIDIGSGLGGFAMHIASAHPDAKVEGIEVAPLPWLVSQLSRLWHRSTAQFRLGDYNRLNFADYNIVFAYLSPAAMQKLWQKASKEMPKGHLLISLEFPVPDVKPTQHLQGDAQSPDLYIYQL